MKFRFAESQLAAESSQGEKSSPSSPTAGLRRDSPESFRSWARQDSNLGPRDYESPALTAELQARATRN